MFAIHLSLYFAVGADDDSIHSYMSGIDLGKLLNTINDHNIVVGIANLDILVVGQCLKCYFFMLFHVAKLLIIFKILCSIWY